MNELLNEQLIMEITLEGKQSKKAERLIEVVFKDHVDKNNHPYIEHLYNVANNFNDEERYTVGLLHDILEDTCVSFNDLAILGFRESCLNSVKLLTRDKDMSYKEYIDLIVSTNNTVALDIKLADLKNNMDKDKLNQLDRETQDKLIEKYSYAYDKISKRREEII